MQESVGVTAARAGIWLNQMYKLLGLKDTVVTTILYDSVVTHTPVEYRWIVSVLHQVCMSDLNVWYYPDMEEESGFRKLQYTIETELLYRWSTKPSKEEAKQLADKSWKPTPKDLEWILTHDFSGSNS